LYANGLESATNAAKAVVLFLNARSGKGKTTKNANEVEYRAIFDALISDILLVLHWPEWPAASLLLNIASKFLVCLISSYERFVLILELRFPHWTMWV
jgi:cohesin loading factor subunit SCC2